METSSAPDTLSFSLNRLLAQEILLSEQLLQLIGLEQTQLEQALLDDNHAQLQSKLALLQDLQSISTQRQNLMLKHGFESTLQGIGFCTLACAHAPAIRQQFSQLSTLARACHGANLMLGQLLNRKSGFFSRLLVNFANTGQPSLYQANGMQDIADNNLRKRLSV